MEVHFDHDKLDVYQCSLEHVAWCARLLASTDAVVSASDHMTRASQSVPRNIVRANSKRSSLDRARLFDIARASGLESAACLDVLAEWKLISPSHAHVGKLRLDRITAMLVEIRGTSTDFVMEEQTPYSVECHETTPLFAHERLRVYQAALRMVRWVAGFVDVPVTGAIWKDLDRHATGVVLNIAEGNGKFAGKDRQRFLGIAHESALQAATTLDILSATGRVSSDDTIEGKRYLSSIVSMLIGLKRSIA